MRFVSEGALISANYHRLQSHPFSCRCDVSALVDEWSRHPLVSLQFLCLTSIAGHPVCAPITQPVWSMSPSTLHTVLWWVGMCIFRLCSLTTLCWQLSVEHFSRSIFRVCESMAWLIGTGWNHKLVLKTQIFIMFSLLNRNPTYHHFSRPSSAFAFKRLLQVTLLVNTEL